MAAHDVWSWSNTITQQLPGSDGTVTYNAVAPPQYTIRVRWQEPGLGLQAHQITITVPDL
jgi:hypothetical protein